MPDELTSSMAIVKFPVLPAVPDAMRGKAEVSLWAVHAGNAAEGEALIRPWLDWHTPISNDFRELPFAEIGTITNDPVEPTAEYGSSDMFDALSDDATDVIVRYATDSASPLVINVLRHAGGAIARVPPNASAFGNRDAQLFLLLGGGAPTAEALTAIQTYTQQYRAALQPYARGGVWMNFMNGNGSGARERIKEAYASETHERLLALKAKYDPDNVFRFSYQLVATESTSTTASTAQRP